MLVVAAPAMGAADPLKGGTTTLNLSSLKVSKATGGAVKAGKKSATLTITGGTLDPTNGTGSVENGGSLKLKKGKKSATLSEVVAGFGSNLSAKLKGKTVNLATLTGGTVGRAGFGGTVTGATAKLTKKGAKALNKAFGTSSFKKGKKLGTADRRPFRRRSLSPAERRSPTVRPGSASSPTRGLAPGAPTPPPSRNSPVTARALRPTPARESPAPAEPATRRRAAQSPVLSSRAAASRPALGRHGQGSRYDQDHEVDQSAAAAYYAGACPEDAAHFPVGDLIQFSNTTNDFTNKVVNVDLTLQAPFISAGFATPTFFGSQIPSGGIDLSTATVTSNPATRTSRHHRPTRWSPRPPSRAVINGTFGVEAVGCGADWHGTAIGDALFTVDLHPDDAVTTRIQEK